MGKSLTQEDVDYLRGKCRVIVINESYQLAPWADWLYAADHSWWDHYIEDVREKFAGELWTQARENSTTRAGSREKDHAIELRIRYCELQRGEGFSREAGKVFSGGSSGYQAMQLAVHMGAEQILLLGFDGYRGTWLQGRPKQFRRESPYSRWKKMYAYADKHCPVPIINCSPGSAYGRPKYQPLRDCLLPDQERTSIPA